LAFFLKKKCQKKITEGEAIKLSFILTQSDRDKDLMNSLIEYLGCGNITSMNRGTIDFKVTKFSSIRDTIIPFFEKYPLQGSKNRSFYILVRW